jgi:FixJ family two-component response regulator
MYSTITVTHQWAKAQMQALDRSVVFVVDDDVSVRESLELLIASAGWQPLLFASAKDFLSHARLAAPSCLVLDVNMPGLNGLDLQSLLTTDGRRIPIIFITGFGDVPTTVRAMKAGAFEFLTKPIDTAALLQAIGSAMERSAALTREDSELAVLQSCYQMLSPREREVMFFVVHGLLNKQVAFELGISEITVKAHRGQMMRKMNARSLPELVKMFARLRLDDQNVIH